jgi:hypothetical protein
MESLRTIGYRLGRIAIALLVVVPASVTMATTASATTCTATGLIKDGINMTAAQIGGDVTGSLNAGGCNIGVYYDNTTSGNVTGATIFGANYFGVVVNGDAGAALVNVTGSTIRDIGETPPNGDQHGVAIYFTNGASGVIDGNMVSEYQKGGIVVNGVSSVGSVPTTATVTNNTVTGLGPVVFIAANGIQVSRGAVAEVRGNSISDNFYTGEVGVGPNPGDQNPEGWEFTSTGLLLFEAGTGTKTSNNHFSGNQRNFANVP